MTKTISKKNVAAVVLGNAVEFFDFTVFATFALTIGKAFFPAEDAFSSVLFAVSTFGIGFVARPLGAMLIGSYADRAGRKPAMLLTMLLMAIGTGGLVVLPTYETIGILAPVLLVVIRIVQGLAWGGEAGSSIIFMMEAAPNNKRGFYTSWQQVAQGMAAIAAGLIGFVLARTLSEQQLDDWGWRVPFTLGLIVLPLGLYMRRNLKETFEGREQIEIPTAGALLEELFSKRLKLVVLGIFLLSGGTITHYFTAYMTTYANTQLHYNMDMAMISTFVVGVCIVIFGLIGGWCSDVFGRRETIIIPRFVLMLLLFPGFYLITSWHNIPVFFAIIILFTALQNISGAGLVIMMCESFPQRLRATGFSITYALGIMLFGGTAQMVLTWLLKVTHNPASPAWYLLLTNIITCVAAVWLAGAKTEN